ncbi:MAG: hypothetical protein KGQ60_15450, partial [Planctomycetes bacterium]|nr:hypothetical protein [Planctomycetota bacterium]
MASESAPPSGFGDPVFQPVPVLLGGLGVIGIAAVCNLAIPDAWAGERTLVISLALIAVGAALAVLLPRLGDEPESRLAAGGLWVLGAIAAFIGSMGVPQSWDSMGLLYRLIAGMAVLAGIIAAVPNGWRKLLASLLIAFHFAAILCAITVVPPPAAPPPFLSVQTYVRWVHSYLIGINLNNGYHFYAPEPGPCALLWYRVQWADGAKHWGRIPDHPQMNNHLERRRMGALATVITQGNPLPPDRADQLIDARMKAAEKRGIPVDPYFPVPTQYREPNPTCRLLMSSYARFLARHTPHPTGATVAVTGIKLYSVEYFNPAVEHFQAGREPLDRTLYAPYYMGDFDESGTLKEDCFRIVLKPSNNNNNK